jgi:CheY-like chemotaxis protein
LANQLNIALLTSDLMVTSRVEGAAQRVGVSLKSVATLEALVSQVAGSAVRLVIVDLSTPSLDVAALVGRVKSLGEASPAIVAFGPHVHESLLAAARDAGCDEVVSRGQFFAQLDAILQRAISARDASAGG